MSGDVLKRVLALIERAGRIAPGSGHDLEDEARTAAHIACVLIHENKLVVSTTAPTPTAQRTVERTVEDFWAEVMKQRGGPASRPVQPQPPRSTRTGDAPAHNKQFGVWEVDCDGGCGRSAGQRSTPWAAAEAARAAGYQVIGGGTVATVTLCPSCIKEAKTKNY